MLVLVSGLRIEGHVPYSLALVGALVYRVFGVHLEYHVAALLAPAAAARMDSTCQVTGTHLAVSSIVSNHAAGAVCGTLLALGCTQYRRRQVPPSCCYRCSPPLVVPPSFPAKPARAVFCGTSESRGRARYLARSCRWVPATEPCPNQTWPYGTLSMYLDQPAICQ